MGLEQFKNRNVGTQNYTKLNVGVTPATGMDQFKQVVKRTFKGELFVGLWVTLREMGKALFLDNMHTVKYPFEKMPISPRYRAIHDMLRLLESGHYRCIGCGLCEKICISNCITMDTRYDENQPTNSFYTVSTKEYNCCDNRNSDHIGILTDEEHTPSHSGILCCIT